MDSPTAARSTRKSLRIKLGAFLAVAVTGATVGVVGVAPALAATNVAAFAKASADSYDFDDQVRQFKVSIEKATEEVIAAIEAAKTEILVHTYRLAAADARACTESAIINLPDLNTLTPDGRQIFALKATQCVTRVNSLIQAVPAAGQVDELGFALNAVGPIALLARMSAGLDTAALQDALIRANEALSLQLSNATACRPQRLDGDSPPGSRLHVDLTCTAYNGERGSYEVVCPCRAGQPLPAFGYTKPKEMALRNTSNAVVRYVLPILMRPRVTP